MKAASMLAVVLATVTLGAAQQPKGTVLGTWKGESLCTVKPSACHDEVVLYEIKPSSENKDHLVLRGDKIVKGKRQMMGDLDCTYADSTGTLTCPISTGVWSFQVKGDTMLGTLKHTDGTLFRKASARRYTAALPPEER